MRLSFFSLYFWFFSVLLDFIKKNKTKGIKFKKITKSRETKTKTSLKKIHFLTLIYKKTKSSTMNKTKVKFQAQKHKLLSCSYFKAIETKT